MTEEQPFNHKMSIDTRWVRDLQHIFKNGHRVSPRGMLVYEVLGYGSIINMNDPIIANPLRKLGYKFMAAEAAWILGGDDRVETIAPYSKAISQFSDDGDRFFGAYGPKVHQQLAYAVGALRDDNDSRQAVINIWRENPGQSKDIPCTLSLQFMIRRGKLNCFATMRSSDLWLGHPYDIFNFSAASFLILLLLRAEGLELELGDLYLMAGSKHLYAKNIEDVSDIIELYGPAGENAGFNHYVPSKTFKVEKYRNAVHFIECLWDAANSDRGALTLLD